MKHKLYLLAVAAILPATSVFATSQREEKPFIVTTEEYSKNPLSPILYGNFIELGYGLQVEAMYGEMLFNRSFEPFLPYRDINKSWYDLYYDDNDHDKGYEKDWSLFDWYHSGYEHNSWYADPGDAGKGSVIFDEETFFHGLTPSEGGSGHGKQCLTVSNDGDSERSVLAQDGKFLVRGKSYSFSGMFKSEGEPFDAQIRFYKQGEWDNPIAVFPIKNINSEFSRKDFVFENTSFDGYATFSLWIPPKSSVTVDDFSLKPTDNYYGWRPEVVEVFKKVNPGVVRFPGGCFASFYDWKEGIGPLSERVPTDSYFWGGQNYNDVGTAEFAMLCKAAGSEMMICVNVNNLANTHSQCVMDTPKEGAYLTAAGKAMEFLSRSPAARVLRIKDYDPPMKEDFQVQAAWDLERQRVVLYICNRTAEKRPADFDLNALGRTFKTCSLTRLHADSPVAMNTLADQDAIKVTKSNGKVRLKKGFYHVEVPAWSFTELILE